jgi:hypothetical protein
MEPSTNRPPMLFTLSAMGMPPKEVNPNACFDMKHGNRACHFNHTSVSDLVGWGRAHLPAHSRHQLADEYPLEDCLAIWLVDGFTVNLDQ